MKKLMRTAMIFIVTIVLVILAVVANYGIAQYAYSQKVVVCYDVDNDLQYTFGTKKYKGYSENEFYVNFPNFRLKNTYAELGTVGITTDSEKPTNFGFCSVFSFIDDSNTRFLEVVSWNNPWKKEIKTGSYEYIDILVCEDFVLPDLNKATIRRVIISDPSRQSIIFEITDKSQINEFLQSYQNSETNFFYGLDFNVDYYEVLLDYEDYPLYECVATVKCTGNTKNLDIFWFSRYD